MPSCTYCRPQIASIGRTQEECERVSHDPKEFLRMIGVTPVEDQEMPTAPSERDKPDE